MKKTKLTLLLLVVAMLVLTLCACQQTYDVTFELGYDNKTEVKTYDKGAKVDFSPTRTDYDFGGLVQRRGFDSTVGRLGR